MRYILIVDETNHHFKFNTLKEMFDFADGLNYNNSFTYEVRVKG